MGQMNCVILIGCTCVWVNTRISHRRWAPMPTKSQEPSGSSYTKLTQYLFVIHPCLPRGQRKQASSKIRSLQVAPWGEEILDEWTGSSLVASGRGLETSRLVSSRQLGCSSVIECLPSVCKAMGPIPSTVGGGGRQLVATCDMVAQGREGCGRRGVDMALNVPRQSFCPIPVSAFPFLILKCLWSSTR